MMCLLQDNPPEADPGGQVHTEQGEVPGGSAVPFRVSNFIFPSGGCCKGLGKTSSCGRKAVQSQLTEWALGGGGTAGFHKRRQAQAGPAK